MREIRQSGSEGGVGREPYPYPYVRQWARTCKEVQVLFKSNLSDLYPTVTASPRGGVESNGRGTDGPQDNERDSALCIGELASLR